MDLESSLQNLGVEYLDVYHVHCIGGQPGDPDEQVMTNDGTTWPSTRLPSPPPFLYMVLGYLGTCSIIIINMSRVLARASQTWNKRSDRVGRWRHWRPHRVRD